MADDSDPGVGVGALTGGASLPAPALINRSCVSFDRSLEILVVGNKAASYGLLLPNICEHLMHAHMREGWIDKIRAASSEIKRDLGAPICPEPIYDEVHNLTSRIRLRQSPVAYLGRATFSDWLELDLEPDGSNMSITICEGDLNGATIDEVQVSYPDSVLECYTGMQILQDPCVTELTDACGAGEDGYKLSWPKYQTIKPDVDETQANVPENFLTAVKWRIESIDSTLAYEYIGDCTCENGQAEPTLTLRLEDATEGIVCINNCDNAGLCYCGKKQIRINYATAFSYGSDVDPALEEAVILLALVKAQYTTAKPCGCDNRMIENLLELDPTASTEFASKLSYGPTVAGMSVMRTMNKFLKRPHFNASVMSGGLLSGRKIRKTERRPSYLRGY